MKKYVFIIGVTLVTWCTNAQEKSVQVPAAVKVAFEKKFPTAKKVEWSKESEKEFEAEFKLGSTEQSANFDSSGTWLETETEIKTQNLPIAVTKAIGKKYPGYKIEEAEKTEKPGSAISYEVKVEKGETSYEVQLSSDGQILKEEMETEDEND